MLDAACVKHKRVVQVGQRSEGARRTWSRARRKVLKAGLLGKIAHVDICCYNHMHATAWEPAGEFAAGVLRLRTLDRPRAAAVPVADAPLYADLGANLPHRRWWRAFTEYGNGIVGDMCIHMLDMKVRLDARSRRAPPRLPPTAASSCRRKPAPTSPDTQTATFAFPELRGELDPPHLGKLAGARLSMGRIHPRRQGNAQGERDEVRVLPHRQESCPPSRARRFSNTRSTRIDKTEKDLERARRQCDPLAHAGLPQGPREPHEAEWRTSSRGIHPASAIRWHMLDFLKAHENRTEGQWRTPWQYTSTAACILANLSMGLGRSVKWDHANTQVVNDAEANKLLKRAYRGPWVHPAV